MEHFAARRQLRLCIEGLEQEDSPYRRNVTCLRALAGAATLLDEHEIADRALRRLRGIPDAAFWRGSLMNFDPPSVVPESFRAVPSMAELEEAHPPYRDDAILGRIRAYAASAPHIALCLSGGVQEARAAAGTELALAEVGATLAVLGEFDAARNVARDAALPAERRSGVALALAIERFRRGKEDAEVLNELEAASIDPWERIILALGFAGREPWAGYPYPDW
jgi:hypothetical protein